MRGPALKGQKMKGFGVKYFSTLSSRKRPGSNTRAKEKMYESTYIAFQDCDYTVRAPEVFPTMHDEKTVENSGTIAVSFFYFKKHIICGKKKNTDDVCAGI